MFFGFFSRFLTQLSVMKVSRAVLVLFALPFLGVQTLVLQTSLYMFLKPWLVGHLKETFLCDVV